MGSWERVAFQLPVEIPSPAPSPDGWAGWHHTKEFVGVDFLGIQGVAQVPWWCRFVFQGIQCNMDNQENRCFSITFAAFSSVEFHPEVWLNLLFRKCWFLSAFAKDPRVGAALEFHSRSLESLSSRKGQVAAKCYFLGFTIPRKLEQPGTCILVSSRLPAAPAPMELGT